VVAVTVGAVQLKLQLCVLLGALCTISPPSTFVPVPAANVPAEAATSTPPLPDVTVLTEMVYVLVDPDATDVGPVSVTAGAVPLLWHDVQVEPLLPENPEIPLLLAVARLDEQMIANARKMIQVNPYVRYCWSLFDCLICMKTDGGIDPAATGLQDNGDVLSATVASFLGRRMAHYGRPGGRRMQ
jgi:hypothetical protein